MLFCYYYRAYSNHNNSQLASLYQYLEGGWLSVCTCRGDALPLPGTATYCDYFVLLSAAAAAVACGIFTAAAALLCSCIATRALDKHPNGRKNVRFWQTAIVYTPYNYYCLQLLRI